ncbi:MAG: hypothetical protein H8E38_04280 [SAR324 cluster bacterium]|nr:hypothetical protein [SAR324 cluster bacterium]
MRGLFKAILLTSLIVGAIILPAYIWKSIDPESYENFLLHSVSPMSQQSRNSILRQRNLNPVP